MRNAEMNKLRTIVEEGDAMMRMGVLNGTKYTECWDLHIFLPLHEH